MRPSPVAAAWALAGVLATAPVAADTPPLACLPPLRSSCLPSPKKDPDAAPTPPRLRPVLATLVYLHTREAVALGPEADADEPELIARLLRDRTNWEPHEIAPACLATLRTACTALGARRVELVSGYRSDKLNEQLRKKGRQVARHSEHSRGQALDFRIVGVPVAELHRHVRRTHVGGIGFYPGSGFVHVDVGRPRRWRGD